MKHLNRLVWMPAVSPDLVLIDALSALEAKQKESSEKMWDSALLGVHPTLEIRVWRNGNTLIAVQLCLTLLPLPVLLSMSIFTNLVHEEVFFRCESKHQTSPICFSAPCVCCSLAQGLVSASDRLHQAMTRVVVFEIQKVAAGESLSRRETQSNSHCSAWKELCLDWALAFGTIWWSRRQWHCRHMMDNKLVAQSSCSHQTYGNS